MNLIYCILLYRSADHGGGVITGDKNGPMRGEKATLFEGISTLIAGSAEIVHHTMCLQGLLVLADSYLGDISPTIDEE